MDALRCNIPLNILRIANMAKFCICKEIISVWNKRSNSPVLYLSNSG